MERSKTFERLGLLSLPAFAVAATLSFFHIISFSYPPGNVSYAVDAILLLFPSIAVVYVAIDAYLTDGGLILLFIGTAVFGFVLTSISSGLTALLGSTNDVVTVFSLGVVLTSTLHLLASVFADGPTTKSVGRLPNLVVSLFVTLLGAVVIGFVTYSGRLPAFLSVLGKTGYYETSLLIAAIAYGGASLIFSTVYLARRNGTLFWWTIGLGLSSMVVVALMLSPSESDSLTWIGLAGLYLSRFCLLFGVLSAPRPGPS